jgi:predicted transposase YdaD
MLIQYTYQIKKTQKTEFFGVPWKHGLWVPYRIQGIEQGRESGKETIARNLLNMSMSIAEIAQATELPVEKVMQMYLT